MRSVVIGSGPRRDFYKEEWLLVQTSLGWTDRSDRLKLERVKGIEPSYRAWEARVLPLNYTRGGRNGTRSRGRSPTRFACVVGRGRLPSRPVRIERIEPGPGQRSVWDFPRPPAVEAEPRPVRVEFGGVVLATSTRALRVLETSHPYGIYIPADDVTEGVLQPAPGSSVCEWKGRAIYWSVVAGGHTSERAAWSYPDPAAGYEMLADHVSFYPGRVSTCWVGDEPVQAQEGEFYGGWITSDVVGPFKGGPGTLGW
jgi:uncharacterized protein (DUF427 family)